VLKRASSLLAALDLDRNRLSSGRLITGGWQKVDTDIKNARSLLEDIRRLVDWTRDETCSRSGLKTRSVEFALRYDKVTRNMRLLSKCMVELEQIRRKFDLMRAREAHLQETRGKTSIALAGQYMRHVIIWAGMGKPTPKPTFSEIQTVEKARKPSPFLSLFPFTVEYETFVDSNGDEI